MRSGCRSRRPNKKEEGSRVPLTGGRAVARQVDLFLLGGSPPRPRLLACNRCQLDPNWCRLGPNWCWLVSVGPQLVSVGPQLVSVGPQSVLVGVGWTPIGVGWCQLDPNRCQLVGAQPLSVGARLVSVLVHVPSRRALWCGQKAKRVAGGAAIPFSSVLTGGHTQDGG